MEWRIGIGGTPSKKFSKKFEKPLDKLPRVCYNKDVKREENKVKIQSVRLEKILGRAEKKS